MRSNAADHKYLTAAACVRVCVRGPTLGASVHRDAGAGTG